MIIRTKLAAGIAALLATTAAAEPIKIGMITTLSGGGAGLGIDVRDGFMLAIKQAGDAAAEIEVIVEDDAQKPEIAVQIADKMIQSDKVDILTGIIWSNLAMAVVPNAVAQGKFYLSPNAGPSQLAGARLQRELLQRRLAERQLPRGDGRTTPTQRLQEDVHPRARTIRPARTR